MRAAYRKHGLEPAVYLAGIQVFPAKKHHCGEVPAGFMPAPPRSLRILRPGAMQHLAYDNLFPIPEGRVHNNLTERTQHILAKSHIPLEDIYWIHGYQSGY